MQVISYFFFFSRRYCINFFAFYRDMVILFHGFTSFSMCRSPIEDNILSITACLLGILSFTERWGWEMKKFLWEHIKGYWISQRQLYADPICHFRNEKGSGAEMLPAIILFLGWLLGTHCSAIGQFFPRP